MYSSRLLPTPYVIRLHMQVGSIIQEVTRLSKTILMATTRTLRWKENARRHTPDLSERISNRSTGNSTFDVTINGKKYDAANLNGTSGYCYDGNGYSYYYLYDRSRCLPDTTDPTYQWGFSTMLSGLFVIFNFTWVISMYILWQDAQINSTLIGTGYQMTPLRAAFAMAKAAKRKTGLGEKQLVRANTKELEQELYGSKGTKATEVEYGIFDEDEEHGEVEIRRRILRPRDEDEVEERNNDEDKDRRKSVEVEVKGRRSGEMSDVPLNP